MSVKAGLPLIARPDARLFILGSLPGDASLAAGEYYAHPTNQFWKLVGAAIGEDLQKFPYPRRLSALAERGIGLWDVISSASRRGSLDQSIRMAQHNQVGRLLHDFRELRAIAFNGTAASVAGRKLLDGLPRTLDIIDLPSSSAANTRPIADKARAWSSLAQFCAQAQTQR